MSAAELAYVRRTMAADEPPPHRRIGAVAWARDNLFADWWNTLLTIIGLYLVWITVPPLVRFFFVDAVWEGTNREACLGPGVGACWAFIRAKFGQLIYGAYPLGERWRVDLVFLMGAVSLTLLLVPRIPYKAASALLTFFIFPVTAFILLTGGRLAFSLELVGGLWLAAFALAAWLFLRPLLAGAPLVGGRRRAAMIGAAAALAVPLTATVLAMDWGLRPVQTIYWGGLLVTLVVAFTGITISLPLGIVLALGRRSEMPLVRLLSTAFIELWRGVPLVTVLFMASVMLPLFMPSGVTVDRLLRALIGVALFASAYMAEVVRGGLQAIPRGQYEAARGLGLGYWQMMGLVILPQALKLVIPGIVNTFIGLFKDTTLVLIIGLFDLLGQTNAARSDPNWATPVTAYTGYAFAGLVFFVFCFGMSRYSMFMERRLDTGYRQ